jgi:hypothetical protein
MVRSFTLRMPLTMIGTDIIGFSFGRNPLLHLMRLSESNIVPIDLNGFFAPADLA